MLLTQAGFEPPIFGSHNLSVPTESRPPYHLATVIISSILIEPLSDDCMVCVTGTRQMGVFWLVYCCVMTDWSVLTDTRQIDR